jgi:hypothetical protein
VGDEHSAENTRSRMAGRSRDVTGPPVAGWAVL